MDSINFPIASGDLTLRLLLGKTSGRELVVLRDSMSRQHSNRHHLFASKEVVNVKEHYNTERLRPHYKSFEKKPLFILTSETG